MQTDSGWLANRGPSKGLTLEAVVSRVFESAPGLVVVVPSVEGIVWPALLWAAGAWAGAAAAVVVVMVVVVVVVVMVTKKDKEVVEMHKVQGCVCLCLVRVEKGRV